MNILRRHPRCRRTTSQAAARSRSFHGKREPAVRARGLSHFETVCETQRKICKRACRPLRWEARARLAGGDRRGQSWRSASLKPRRSAASAAAAALLGGPPTCRLQADRRPSLPNLPRRTHRLPPAAANGENKGRRGSASGRDALPRKPGSGLPVAWQPAAPLAAGGPEPYARRGKRPLLPAPTEPGASSSRARANVGRPKRVPARPARVRQPTAASSAGDGTSLTAAGRARPACHLGLQTARPWRSRRPGRGGRRRCRPRRRRGAGRNGWGERPAAGFAKFSPWP